MYANLKGFELTFYKQTKYKYSNDNDEYVKINDIENYGSHELKASKKDLGDVIEQIPNADYFYISGYTMDRKDPDLVKVVETLGEKANGDCAELAIKKLKYNVKWRIDKYDGAESVETMDSYDWID